MNKEKQNIKLCDLPPVTPRTNLAETSQDCISREAAINTVVFGCGGWIGIAKEINKQLRQLPSVTPKAEKRGIEMTSDEKMYYIETLEQIRFRSEERGWDGEVEAIDYAIEALEAQEVEAMTINEAIKHCEEVAEAEENKYSYFMESAKSDAMREEEAKCKECASEHRQLAEWLRELKTHREIHDILLQTFVDFDLDICCDDLMNNEEEQKICEENCNNKTKGCWVRWAKMKARGSIRRARKQGESCEQ